MKKCRSTIPVEMANKILVKAKRTCCVCREYGRPVQVHHIDSDPNNNDEDNLAVLCLLCHNDTLTNGGFGRKLNEGQIRMYRDEWTSNNTNDAQVKEQTSFTGDIADKSNDGDRSHCAISELYKHASSIEYQSDDEVETIQLLVSLPQRYKIFSTAAHQQINKYTTADIVIGSGSKIEALKKIIVELVSYCPESLFTAGTAKDYADKMSYDAACLYRAILEPEGPGTGGTIVGPMTCGFVIEELETKVALIARALHPFCSSFRFEYWKRAWQTVCNNDPAP